MPFLFGRALTEAIHKRNAQEPAAPRCTECGALLDAGDDVTCEACENAIEARERAEAQQDAWD